MEEIRCINSLFASRTCGTYPHPARAGHIFFHTKINFSLKIRFSSFKVTFSHIGSKTA